MKNQLCSNCIKFQSRNDFVYLIPFIKFKIFFVVVTFLKDSTDMNNDKKSGRFINYFRLKITSIIYASVQYNDLLQFYWRNCLSICFTFSNHFHCKTFWIKKMRSEKLCFIYTFGYQYDIDLELCADNIAFASSVN